MKTKIKYVKDDKKKTKNIRELAKYLCFDFSANLKRKLLHLNRCVIEITVFFELVFKKCKINIFKYKTMLLIYKFGYT